MAKFDFFRQANQDTARSTVFGGFISLLCIITMTYLLLTEVGTFASSSIEVSTTVENNFDDLEYAILSLNVTVHDIPCSILTVEFTNDMKLGVEDELDQDTLARTRIYPNGTQSKGDDVYKTTQSWTNRTQIENYMKDKLVEGESCNMFGIIQVQRSPGNIHISTHKRPLHV